MSSSTEKDEKLAFYRKNREREFLPVLEGTDVRSEMGAVSYSTNTMMLWQARSKVTQDELDIDLEIFARACTEMCATDAETVRDTLKFGDTAHLVFEAAVERAKENRRLAPFVEELRAAAGMNEHIDNEEKIAGLAREMVTDACVHAARLTRTLDASARDALLRDLIQALADAFGKTEE